MSTKPVNYLNNRDILKQIHLSKNSYSSFLKPEYHQYDYIVNIPNSNIHESLSSIDSETIQKAKEARAARLSYELGEKISPTDIAENGLIFRIMTWDHIPVMPPKEAKKPEPKKTAKEIFDVFEEDSDESAVLVEVEDILEEDVDDHVHVRVNFPPFQHYLYENGALTLVGKSHWKGNLETGHFSKDHGKITDKLAWMYIKICEKYASKYNWRGYSYNDEMQGTAILQLTYVGLRFNESRSQNPFAFYTTTLTNSFRRVLTAEKKIQNLRDDILEMNGMQPSWTRQNECADSDYHGY